MDLAWSAIRRYGRKLVVQAMHGKGGGFDRSRGGGEMKVSGLSKSAAKALDCEAYFREYYLQPGSLLKRIASPIRDAGSDFHRFRQEYITYLLDKILEHDQEWATDWLAASGVSSEAADLIRRDIPTFRIDPAVCLGAEVFLSCDDQLGPLDCKINAKYESMEPHEESWLRGYIDQIDLVFPGAQCGPSTAYLFDIKTGFSSNNLNEYEPAMYALMAFAQFSSIEAVQWAWEFVRSKSMVFRRFTREQIPELLAIVQDAHLRRTAAEDRWCWGEKPSVNPYSGLCAHCHLHCEARQAAMNGTAFLGPVKTQSDLVQIAGVLKTAEDVASRARVAMAGYLETVGAVDLPGGYEARIVQSSRRSFPLRETLGVLGVKLAGEAKWDVPLDKLCVSGTQLSSLARATRKRPGMSEALDAIAEVSPHCEVRVGRKREQVISDAA
jgi:hypothetical protein